MDLVVDLNFRMDTSALYSDIILPAATWYEKADLNSTDMHSFIHPLSPGGAAVLGIEERLGRSSRRSPRSSPSWPRSTFPNRSKMSSRRRLAHDSPAEIAQPDMKQWIKGECRGDPRQDDAQLQDRQARLQEPLQPIHLVRTAWSAKNGLGAHGTSYSIEDEYDEYLETHPHRDLGRQDLSVARTTTIGRVQRDPALRHGHQRRTGLPVVQEHGREDGPAAGASGREEPRRPHDRTRTFRASRGGSSTARCGRG